ncbi:MAG: hypothetical protein OXH65_05215 [Paracoccaceae bacterium]|nr:hypothetical protein [Paracoccaceae bacterium]
MNQTDITVKKGYYRHLVLKVDRYDLETTLPGCYPGSVKGEVMGGPLNGRTVSLSLKTTPGNGNVARLKEFADPESKRYTPTEGFLAFSSVAAKGNRITASQVSRFAGPDTDIRRDIFLQFAPVMDTSTGGVRRFKLNNATMYRAYIVDPGECRSPWNMDELRETVSEIFSTGEAALLALINRDNTRETLALWPGWRNGQPLTLGESVSKALAEPNQSRFSDVLARGGKIDVLPLDSMFVSPFAAASIDQGIRDNIPARGYRTGGLGARIDKALTSIGRHSPLSRAYLESEFMASLPGSAKDEFAEHGWQGIEECHIGFFLADLGIKPPKVPTYGYALSTVAVNWFEGKDGQNLCSLTKARPLGPVLTRNHLPTVNDPGAHMKFLDVFDDLVAKAIRKVESRVVDLPMERDMSAGREREFPPQPGI